MQRSNLFTKSINALISACFLFTQIGVPAAQAQTLPTMMVNLPVGAMLKPTATFQPVQILGINFNAEDPLRFDFIIDRGDSALTEDAYHDEASKVIKYFVSSLAMPENQMWVNLSPYEANRIIPDGFGKTEMGRDLLALDYMLKQLVSSLMYPKDELGEKFWTRVKEKAMAQFGSAEIPMNTFNKIWIVPQTANIYEHAHGAFIVDSRLKVMLEEDYLALNANRNSNLHGLGDTTEDDLKPLSGVSADVVREVLIPELEREVNEGEIFANLRQIYNAVILAGWYKGALKDSLLGQGYVDQFKTEGNNVDDPAVIDRIYERYVDAFKTGVYNYIEEEYDPASQKMLPRKYFSGGADLNASNIRNITNDIAYGYKKGADRFTVDLASSSGKQFVRTARQTDASELQYPDWIKQIVPEELLYGNPKEVWGESTAMLEGVLLQPREEFASFFLADGPHTPIRNEFYESIADRRMMFGWDNDQVRFGLFNAQKKGISLYIKGSLRLIDGANGTSHDLPEAQDGYVDGMTERLGRQLNSFHEFPATSFLSSAIKAIFRVEMAEDPTAIEYYSPSKMKTVLTLHDGDIPDFRETPDKRFVGKGGQKYANAVYHILHDIFGLEGIRVNMDAIDAIAELGGMESSNAFVSAIVAIGSILSGVDMNLAEIYGLAVKLENYELGGLTGGQGNIAFLLGGSQTITWTSGIKNAEGEFVNAYSAVVSPFLNGNKLDKFKEQAVLLQPGISYRKGEKIIPRTAGEINRIWMMLAELNHPLGMLWHLRTIDFKNMSEQALRNGDYKTASYAHLLYVHARNMFVRITLEAAFRGKEAIDKKDETLAHPMDIEIANRIFFSEQSNSDFEVIHQFLEMGVQVNGERMDGLEYLKRPETVLYLDDNVYDMWIKAAQAGIYILGLGAGGPGANFVALTDNPRGKKHIKEWLANNYDIGPIDLDQAAKIVNGEQDGRIEGYMDIETDDQPVQFNGFEEVGFRVPKLPRVQEITLEDVGIEKEASNISPILSILKELAPGIQNAVELSFEESKYRVSNIDGQLNIEKATNNSQIPFVTSGLPQNKTGFFEAVRNAMSAKFETMANLYFEDFMFIVSQVQENSVFDFKIESTDEIQNGIRLTFKRDSRTLIEKSKNEIETIFRKYFNEILKQKSSYFDLDIRMDNQSMTVDITDASNINQNEEPAFTKGGIDLNPAISTTTIEREGKGFEMAPVDPVLLQQIQNAPGLVPVIINVTPNVSVPLMLGFADELPESNQAQQQLVPAREPLAKFDI